MRIALFSDVHAIIPAFHAFKDDAREQDVEVYWFLGDMIGYGTLPVNVIKAMRKLMVKDARNITLAGNHEYLALGKLSTKSLVLGNYIHPQGGMDKEATKIAARHGEQVKNDANLLYAWLNELPVQLPVPGLAGFYLAHGFYHPALAKDDLWQYATKDADLAWKQYAALKTVDPHVRFLAVGHRHVPVLWQWDNANDNLIQHNWSEGAHTFRFDALQQRPLLVNPGSIALPRGGSKNDSNATYAILDIDKTTEMLTIEYRILSYDWRDLAKNTINENYYSPLGEELNRQLRSVTLPPDTNEE